MIEIAKENRSTLSRSGKSFPNIGAHEIIHITSCHVGAGQEPAVVGPLSKRREEQAGVEMRTQATGLLVPVNVPSNRTDIGRRSRV